MRSFSCCPQYIYQDGGFYENMNLLQQLRSDHPRFERSCELIASVYPSYACNFPAQKIYTDSAAFVESLASYEDHIRSSFKRGAASVLCRLNHCYVRNNVLYLADHSQLAPMYECQRLIDRPYVDTIPSVAPGSDVEWVAAAKDTIDTFIGSAGSGNYGHWLVDDAPRLKGVIDYAIQHSVKNVRVFVTGHGEKMNAVRKECLRTVVPRDLNVELIPIPVTGIYFFENILYTSPNSYHPAMKSSASLSYLRKMVLQGLPQQISGQIESRIFVTRRQTRVRGITNIDEILPIFERHRFKIVDTEGMSFTEQASLFSRALIVIGQMGAAMTNTVFCQPGCSVLHLAPLGWQEPFYWDLAINCGHNYAAVYGPVSDTTVSPHMSSFSIDPVLLLRALTDIGL